jgi:hypothetical protein
MSDTASPATRFHDVEVANDQTGAVWHAPEAFIRAGLIVVTGRPPRGFFDRPGSTFTISASDRGNRRRRFPLLTLDPIASRPPDDFAFN